MMTRTRLRRSVSFLIAMLAIVSFNQLSAQPRACPDGDEHRSRPWSVGGWFELVSCHPTTRGEALSRDCRATATHLAGR